MRISILGVQIDAVNATDVRRRIEEFLLGQGSHAIVTPNPEFVVAAQKNQEFRNVLNQADLAIPDGVGLILAARILGLSLRERVTGVKAVQIIAEIAAREGKSIFLLGGKEGVATQAAEALREKYPSIKIVGAESGGKINFQFPISNFQLSWIHEDGQLLNSIAQAKPDILLVALGQVKQEFWIRDRLHLFPSVRIAMGVGGALDYLAGAVSQPPRLMLSLGLEWLWRLITQPWRVGRIYTATIRFMYLVLKHRFTF